MTATTNATRYDDAETTLEAYAEAIERSGRNDKPCLIHDDQAQECLGDLLADLRHWARGRGYDFDQISTMAEINFNAEVDEDPDDQEDDDAEGGEEE